jgi:CubicO group peptidase (beta-lactamase class C family)
MDSRLLLVVSLTACTSTIDSHTPPATDDPRFAPLIAAVARDLEATAATAASVSVWLDGEIIWVGGFGRFDPDGRIPGANTLFMIGSDTKKLTAISLLRRVQAGKATLDTTIATVLPQLQMANAPTFTRATIRQLLSNQGGILDSGELTATTTDAGLETYALGTFAQNNYEMAPPGRIYNYSNPNFSIAGLMDERLGGKRWPDLVAQEVFAPLGMTRTFARKSELDADYAPGFGPSAAVANDTTDGHVPIAELWDSAFARPAGLVWSTPSDQMRLAEFLVDGNAQVLKPALLAEVVKPHVRTYPDLPGGYAFGLEIQDGLLLGDDYYDVPVWIHGGNTLTHTSAFVILPEQRFAVSILANSGEDLTETLRAALRLADLPVPSAPPPAPTVDPAMLNTLTGTYVDPNNLGTVIVTRTGNTLQIDCPDLTAAQVLFERALTPISTHVWLASFQGQELDIAFVPGTQGEMYFRNRAFVAIRGGTARQAPPPSRDAILGTLRAAKQR